MHSRTVHQQRSDVPDVYSNGDRSGAFFGSFLAEFDDLFAIEVGDVEPRELGS
jgi:hypothetical protein